jgi:ribonuclease HII
MTPRVKFDSALIPERPDLSFELALWREGCRFVAGVDEAGRGAIAGPVAAGAVVLPDNIPGLFDQLHGVRDSKVMTAQEREKWALRIKAIAVSWGVGFASHEEIDAVGIAPATRLAVSRALEKLNCPVEYILVDYIKLPEIKIPQTPLVKGDARSLSIAAASILAKTARDALMVEMDEEFPGYAFASNKGYGTEAHRKAIDNRGPCEQHRRTFAPVSVYLSLFPPVNGD